MLPDSPSCREAPNRRLRHPRMKAKRCAYREQRWVLRRDVGQTKLVLPTFPVVEVGT